MRNRRNWLNLLDPQLQSVLEGIHKGESVDVQEAGRADGSE